MKTKRSFVQTFLTKPEHYIFRTVAIVSFALLAIAFVAAAIAHTWRFIEGVFK